MTDEEQMKKRFGITLLHGTAKNLRMNVFLLTDCLINKTNKDISKYNNGGFSELLQFIGSSKEENL